MIDIHNHTLFNIDDGSSSIEESIELIKKYYKLGVRYIILTPHYILDGEYNANNKIKIEKIKLLRQRLVDEQIDVTLFIGNEVYLNKNIIELLKNKEIACLNNSRYLLIELPFINEDANTISIIHDLVLSGITPIIAHVERYKYIIKDIDKLYEYKDKGALIQINSGSLFNKYGKEAKKTVKKIIKNRLADFIATDIHHSSDKMYSSGKIKNKIANLTDKKYAKLIMIENQIKVIKNHII